MHTIQCNNLDDYSVLSITIRINDRVQHVIKSITLLSSVTNRPQRQYPYVSRVLCVTVCMTPTVHRFQGIVRHGLYDVNSPSVPGYCASRFEDVKHSSACLTVARLNFLAGDSVVDDSLQSMNESINKSISTC